jgi:hypothetical protein
MFCVKPETARKTWETGCFGPQFGTGPGFRFFSGGEGLSPNSRIMKFESRNRRRRERRYANRFREVGSRLRTSRRPGGSGSFRRSDRPRKTLRSPFCADDWNVKAATSQKIVCGSGKNRPNRLSADETKKGKAAMKAAFPFILFLFFFGRSATTGPLFLGEPYLANLEFRDFGHGVERGAGQAVGGGRCEMERHEYRVRHGLVGDVDFDFDLSPALFDLCFLSVRQPSLRRVPRGNFHAGARRPVVRTIGFHGHRPGVMPVQSLFLDSPVGDSGVGGSHGPVFRPRRGLTPPPSIPKWPQTMAKLAMDLTLSVPVACWVMPMQ